MLTKGRSSFHRLLEINLEVQANRFPNVTTLAKLLGWSEKTIRRDLEYLRDSLGAPLVYDRRRRGFFYSRPNYQFPSIAISEGELLGVFLGSQLLRQYRGTELGEHLARLYAKLADFLPSTVEVDFSDLPQTYSTRPAPAEAVEPSIMQSLLKAVRERRSLEIVYHSTSRDLTQQRRIDPYGFHFVDGECYMVAYCHLREDVRIFHPGRIRELKRTQETFERVADFDLTRYIDEGFRHLRGSGPAQQVTLRFSPVVARYVQGRTWHPTQRTEAQPDGSLLLRFTINHLLEVKRLALSFGPDCEVLEPASLHEELEADVRAMMQRISERRQPTTKGTHDGERKKQL
jgi:predicted DNA-binding transcriptional regulator YafY